VVLGARRLPEIPEGPLLRRDGVIHKVVETTRGRSGLILKSLVVDHGRSVRFLARIDERPDGLVVRLDDHMEVERTPEVFDHLAELARLVLAANPGSALGPTNLADRIARLAPWASASRGNLLEARPPRRACRWFLWLPGRRSRTGSTRPSSSSSPPRSSPSPS
jgi:hypothetical protein